jgi:hypothetical protein
VVQDNLTGVVEDAQVHCPGVQIDAAVESVSLVVKAHHGLLWNGSGSLSPHRGWKATSFLKIPRLGRSFAASSPYTLGTGPGPSQARP